MSNQKGAKPMRKQMTIRLEASMLKWLEKLAEEDRRSVADIIRMIIDDARSKDWKP